MADYGLLSTGFVPKPLDVIREDINTALRDAFGPSIDLSDGSVLGQLAGIMAERFALLWELAEAVNASQDPDAATGVALEALCTLTGVQKRPASPTTATVVLAGDVATEILSGRQISVVDNGDLFDTDEDVTLAAADAWAPETDYAVGDVVVNDTPDRIYLCTDPGNSAGSGGPTGTGTAITDDGVVWRYLGDGDAFATVDVTALETGPIVAPELTLTVIETPVAGWTGVANSAAGTTGFDVEADADLRVRRNLALSAGGTSTPDAIRAALLALADVTHAHVLYNNTDVTVDTIPPHAVEALVIGGDDQEIYDTLLAQVAAGIATHGNTDGTAEDSEGVEHDVSFTRPDEIEIYVTINVLTTDEDFPADGEAQIEAQILEWGAAFEPGRDVIANQILAQVFDVAGVVNVGAVYIGTAPSPGSSATISIATRELATFTAARIVFAV